MREPAAASKVVTGWRSVPVRPADARADGEAVGQRGGARIQRRRQRPAQRAGAADGSKFRRVHRVPFARHAPIAQEHMEGSRPTRICIGRACVVGIISRCCGG
jgi:hypothetical protein